MNALPRVRSGLLRHELDDQILVYDSQSDKVHLLDRTTARVMELLQEGGWTEPGMLVELQESVGVPVDSQVLMLAIDSLHEAGILEDQPGLTPVTDVTRRDVVRKIAIAGAAAVLIPAITTLTATKGYAQATNSVAACGACTNPNQCIGGAPCGTQGACGSNKTPNGGACSGGSQSAANTSCCSGTCSANPGICV